MQDEMLQAFLKTLKKENYPEIATRMESFIAGWKAHENSKQSGLGENQASISSSKRGWTSDQRRKFNRTMAAKKARK